MVYVVEVWCRERWRVMEALKQGVLREERRQRRQRTPRKQRERESVSKRETQIKNK